MMPGGDRALLNGQTYQRHILIFRVIISPTYPGNWVFMICECWRFKRDRLNSPKNTGSMGFASITIGFLESGCWNVLWINIWQTQISTFPSAYAGLTRIGRAAGMARSMRS